MELLLVTGSFPERSETFIYRKAVALARRGHSVTVATRSIGDWSIYPEPLPSNLRVEQLPPDSTLRDPRRAVRAAAGLLRASTQHYGAARHLYENCQRDASPHRSMLRHIGLLGRRADIVHFEFLSLAAMYPHTRDAISAPIVASCRGNDVHTLELRTESERALTIETLRTADALHCVSDEMARSVARISGRTKGIWINRPAVNVETITPRAIPPRRTPVRLLATGRLVWKKGFDYLLTALARLARRGIEFRAEILGDGPLRSYLRYSIEDLGLENHVTLAGAVSSSEVLSRMQSTDVFVLSSVEEGISNAVLEAMATGIPIVTTNAGGMDEAVSDGVEGYVVEVRDVPALEDKLERVIVDRELRIKMGRAARHRIEREFSISRQADTFEALYQAVGARS